jgi:hypothetical protein
MWIYRLYTIHDYMHYILLGPRPAKVAEMSLLYIIVFLFDCLMPFWRYVDVALETAFSSHIHRLSLEYMLIKSSGFSEERERLVLWDSLV